MGADLKEAIDEKRIAQYLPTSNKAYDERQEDGRFTWVSRFIVSISGSYSGSNSINILEWWKEGKKMLLSKKYKKEQKVEVFLVEIVEFRIISTRLELFRAQTGGQNSSISHAQYPMGKMI